MAETNEDGIASTSFFLSPSKVSIQKNRPDRNTTPKAVSHGTLSPNTRLYAKKALSPIPGAMAMGAFADNPTIIVARALTMQVTAINASLSIPVLSLRMSGLVKMIYAIVRNVVRPATHSILKLVCL